LNVTNPLPWDSKVSIICRLQNLTGNSRSSWYFLSTLLWVLWVQTYFCHTVFCLLFTLFLI